MNVDASSVAVKSGHDAVSAGSRVVVVEDGDRRGSAVATDSQGSTVDGTLLLDQTGSTCF